MTEHEASGLLGRPEAATAASDDFVNLVRDALTHLYDFAHLECHPLARCVPPRAIGTGRTLRNLLMDTMDELQPESSVPAGDRAWRPYHILMRRYVDGFGIDAITSDMHISLRQYHRDHRKGLRAMSELLWSRWSSGAHDAVVSDVAPPTVAADDQVLGEVARLGVDRRRLDLGSIVASVIDSARSLALEREIPIETHNPSESVIVWADLALARQAALSTVSALIAAHSLRLDISWRSTSDLGILEVRPTPPLPNDGSAPLMELAHKCDGILPLVEAQHAELEVLRQDGAITAVQLLFPKAVGALVHVVDDDALLLQLFERYLASDGYRFQGFRDAANVLGAARADRPSVIVLDVMMRGVDGWQLLQTLHADPDLAQVPVVVCSVLDEVDLAMSLGAQSYVRKPVSQQQLLTAVRNALGECGQEAPHPEWH